MPIRICQLVRQLCKCRSEMGLIEADITVSPNEALTIGQGKANR